MFWVGAKGGSQGWEPVPCFAAREIMWRHATAAPHPPRDCPASNPPSPAMQAVERAGYKKPSPIQMAALPLGMRFQDVIGIAGALRMLCAAHAVRCACCGTHRSLLSMPATSVHPWR